MVAVPVPIRLAVYTVWEMRCAYCWTPLDFDALEVDHIIPKALTGDALHQQLKLHGLPEDFDKNSPENLVASCRPDNGCRKGKKPPPQAPSIALILQQARDRAPRVTQIASSYSSGAKADFALAQLLDLAKRNPDSLDEERREKINTLAEALSRTYRFRGLIKDDTIIYGDRSDLTSRRVILIDPESSLPKVALVLEQNHEKGKSIQNGAEPIAWAVRTKFGDYLTVLHYDERGTWEDIWLPVPFINGSPVFAASWDECPPGARVALRQAGFRAS